MNRASCWPHSRGVDQQKVADQAQFDKLNASIADQEALANAKYRTQQNANLALATERDALKVTLEKEHETNRIATAALRDRYAAVGLWYTSGQSTESGLGGRRTEGASVDPTSASGVTVVQLPDAITSDLRRLAFDADELADSYRECYGYAKKLR